MHPGGCVFVALTVSRITQLLHRFSSDLVEGKGMSLKTLFIEMLYRSIHITLLRPFDCITILCRISGGMVSHGAFLVFITD